VFSGRGNQPMSMSMKIVALVLALAAAGGGGYVAWNRFQAPPPARLAAALEEAKKENKLVLLDFTGSDWCGWCMKLEADSLGKPEFIDYAAKYLMTVVVDFPMHRTLPEDVKNANKALKSQYGVEGFPTLIALSPDGKVIWKQAGYIEGGPNGIITPLEQARKALGMPEPGVANSANATTTPNSAGETSQSAGAAAAGTHALPGDAPRLQALLYSRKHSTILLGGIQCGEGDSVGGMRVVKILPDRVKVEWQGRTEELMLQ
jgi:thiol-disulfide isomerase/thioredoxin